MAPHFLRVTLQGSRPLMTEATRAAAIDDVQLLRSACLFLAQREGSATGVGHVDGCLNVLLSEDVEAYGEKGRDAVGRVIADRRGSYVARCVNGVCAFASANLVRVDYRTEIEMLHFRESSDDPGAERVLLCRVDTIGLPVHTMPPAAQSTFVGARRASPVQVLWWSVRFLVADVTHNYDDQAKWLSDSAQAFGEMGPDAVVRSNKACAESGVTYTVPYTLTVDEVHGKVSMPFDAWKNGALAYRGTDVYEVDETSSPVGKISRIITINHSDCKCWSAASSA